MIDHSGLKVSDPVSSRRFYDVALAPLGYRVLMEVPTEHTGGRVVLGYGVPPKPDFWVAEGTPETPRVHIAFRAASRAEVDAFHRAALAAGGRDNGPPGPRPHYHAGVLRRVRARSHGHNIEVVSTGTPEEPCRATPRS